MFDADPHPELRCRCVSRRQLPKEWTEDRQWPDNFIDRCERKATQEDGLCDICREPNTNHPFEEFIYYKLDDPTTPCWLREKGNA